MVVVLKYNDIPQFPVLDLSLELMRQIEIVLESRLFLKKGKKKESMPEKNTRWFLLVSEVSPVKQSWQIHVKDANEDVLKYHIFPTQSRIM